MSGRARGVLRFAPLWIWLAISLTILGVGAGGLVNRAREGARLHATGTPVTATVTMETHAGKALPFGHPRTKIWIWYEYQRTTHKTVLACGSFDGCPHRGDTMTLWLDPANPAHFITEYGDLADDVAADWFLTVVGGLATVVPLAVLFMAWRGLGRTPGPRRHMKPHGGRGRRQR